MPKKLEIGVGIATIFGVLIAAIALIPAFGDWLSPRSPSTETAATGPTTESILVAANTKWENTGILIEDGEILQITHISGKWRTEPGVSWINGFECTSRPCDDCLLPTAPEGSLIAKVGNGDALCAGNSPFVSKYSGFLHLSFNDAYDWFHDNEGSLTVQVKITKP